LPGSDETEIAVRIAADPQRLLDRSMAPPNAVERMRQFFLVLRRDAGAEKEWR